MRKIINLLQWQPGYSGFSSYIKRVLPHIDGLRLQVNQEGLVDLIELNDWTINPPSSANLLHNRLLQRSGLLQYGVSIRNLCKNYNFKLEEIDLIYSPFLDPILQLKEKPQLLTCPDLIPVIYKESNRSYYRTKILFPFYCSLATKLITYSKHVADQLLLNKISSAKISVIPCGIDVCRERVKVPKSNDIIVIARHDKHKNLIFLLQSLLSFKSKNPSWRGKIKIVGKRGRITRNLYKIIKDFPNPKDIELLEKIDSSSFIKLLRNSFVLISSSAEEGFDYPILEAKAEGIPTLISDIGVHREFHSESSQFFNIKNGTDSFCDALRELLIDDSMWTDLSLKGYELAKSMTIGNQVTQISTQIDEIS